MNWKQRLTRRNLTALLVAVLVFGTLGAAEGLYQRAFGEESWGYAFDNIEAEFGETVDVDHAWATVYDFEASYLVKTAEYENQALRSNGIFLVVRMRTANPGPGINDLGEAHIVYSDGRSTETLGGAYRVPKQGFQEDGVIYFEVDPDRLVGARLTLFQKELTHRYRTRAVIDLGIDDAKAADLRATPADKVITLTKPEYRAIG